MHKLLHYRKKCIGCAVCVEIQPEFWRMSKKDGKATLIHAILKRDVHQLDIHHSQLEKALQVVEMCPVRIIKLS